MSRVHISDVAGLAIREMRASDPDRLAEAFADMNKTREQYERYWREKPCSSEYGFQA